MAMSNSTMTQFLGGKTKTWMTRPQVETRRPSAPQPQPREVVNGGSGSRPKSPELVKHGQNADGIHQPSVAPVEGRIHNGPDSQPVSESSMTPCRVGQQANATTRHGAATTGPSPLSPSLGDEIYMGDSFVHSIGSMEQSSIAQQVPGTSNADSATPPTRVTSLPAQLSLTEGSQTDPEAAGATVEWPEPLLSQGQPAESLPTDIHGYRPGIDWNESPGQYQWPTPPAANSRGGVPGQSLDPRNTIPSTRDQQSDPLGLGLRTLLPRIASRLESTRRSQQLASTGRLEEGRLSLLQDACMAGDVFYLTVHQMYCLATTSPAQQVENFGFNTFHLLGLTKLAELILPNTGLQSEATAWFSEFPGPVDALLKHSTIYQNVFNEAYSCIEQLGRNWDQFKKLCLAQRSPPLVTYMEIDLGVKSMVLQHVVYTAIQRVLWIGHQDDCFQNCGKLFLGDQDASQRWNLQRNSNNPPSKEVVTAYYQNLTEQYQRIQIHHLQHVRQGNQVHVPQFQSHSPSMAATMGPPQQNQISHLSGNLRSPSGVTPNPFEPRRMSIEHHLPVDMHRHHGIINEQASQGWPHSWPTIPTRSFSNRSSSGSSIGTDGRLVSTNGVLHQSGDLTPLMLLNNQFGTPSSVVAPTGTNSAVTHRSAARQTPVLPSSGRFHRPGSSGHSTPLQSPLHSSLVGSNIAQAHFRGSPAQSYATQLPPRIVAGVNSPLVSHRQSSSPAMPPTGFQTPGGTHSPAPPPTSFFIPPAGYSMPYVAQPELYNLSMHQAHLRDPQIIVEDSSEASTDKPYYQYLKGLSCTPLLVEPTTRIIQGRFFVAAAVYPLLPKDEPQARGAPSQRKVRVGSRIFRLRCIELGNQIDPSDCQWAMQETSWPSNLTITLNGTNLDMRRKSHYGKDLPIDLTPFVKEGANEIHVAVLRVGQTVLTKSSYAIAVEIIHVGDLGSVMDLVRRAEGDKVQDLIRKLSLNKDPEVEVVGSSVAISIVDPFSLSLIKVPVRGESCRHYECFDLDLFLLTRQGSPCKPEQFRCPICNGDARPDQLIVDTWFEKVLHSIREMKRTDARSIVVESTGDWRIQEEKVEGETGDGTGLRRRKEDAAPRRPSIPERSSTEVVVID